MGVGLVLFLWSTIEGVTLLKGDFDGKVLGATCVGCLLALL